MIFVFFRTEQLIFLYVLLFVIILGNVIVILSLGCIRRRKSRMNFFILHLAVAGKLLSLFGFVENAKLPHNANTSHYILLLSLYKIIK